MNNVLKIVFLIIAALIGAGFASGQELYVFFYSYGAKGLLGVLVCSFIFGYVAYKVLKIISKNDINNYNDFIKYLTNSTSKRKYFNATFIINTIVNIFMLIIFYIMIAGFGAYFSQEFGINNYLGSALLAVMCFITFMTSVNGVIKINSILTPILIIFVIIIGFINFNSIDITTIGQNLDNVDNGSWLLSGILYASYNVILLIPVLVTLKKYVKSQDTALFASVFGGIIIALLAVAIFLLLARVDIDIDTLEMPAVYVVGEFFSGFKFIYAFIILASIYTTAISIGVSLLKNITKDERDFKQIAGVICISGVIISGLGFSNLINLLYPIFGYLGLIQIFALIRKKV